MDKEQQRRAWIDDQMAHGRRAAMWDTIRAGVAAGIGTTCSTVTIGLLKFATLAVLSWLGTRGHL